MLTLALICLYFHLLFQMLICKTMTSTLYFWMQLNTERGVSLLIWIFKIIIFAPCTRWRASAPLSSAVFARRPGDTCSGFGGATRCRPKRSGETTHKTNDGMKWILLWGGCWPLKLSDRDDWRRAGVPSPFSAPLNISNYHHWKL